GIPGAGDGDLLAVDVFGAQRLAEPAFIVGDQVRCGGEDVAGRAVVALQANDFRAWKVMFEAQDIVDLRAAPAVDRLVVVADAADVFGQRGGRYFFLRTPCGRGWRRVKRDAGGGGLFMKRRVARPLTRL